MYNQAIVYNKCNYKHQGISEELEAVVMTGILFLLMFLDLILRFYHRHKIMLTTSF